jgi:hypothetical protein
VGVDAGIPREPFAELDPAAAAHIADLASSLRQAAG